MISFVVIVINSLTTVTNQAKSESNTKTNLKIIVFAPHPDDELIGCGGSIAKHIKNGNEVSVVYMTSGDSGNIGINKNDLAIMREEEASRGAKMLGVKELIFLRNPDGYLEASKENLIKLMRIIREKQPNVVYVTSKEEGHKDHRTTNELVMNAVGRASGPWFQEVEGKPWEVSHILEYEVHPPMSSTSYCEDITDFIDLKVKALEEHKSQIEDIHYQDSSRALAEYRGILTSGKSKYAECFKIVKTQGLFGF
ncbi:MAG: PIG-L deacetylase family protein [Candidatus Caenarcaniphilales bacterium]|nr:PIG-L deacetylase family protein [Candidatus Caenarcaniphilales bacterium]